MTAGTANIHVILAPSSVGWIALADSSLGLQKITFGYQTPQRALAALPDYGVEPEEPGGRREQLVRRLQRFLDGNADDFLDVPLDLSQRTAFQSAVIDNCRRIPHGHTCSYGELAARSGSPRAARAVGSVMANNCFPLVVPCHRVVGASSLGGFSSPRGLAMKRQLLRLEGVV